ncbi:MAG: D-alanyl-D-alanine carboxypeptidase family protein [Candidatus Choladocola sp.]|nr:D-alanyl-D-alanine carboxypeptidase family protein [Candidatus Choladocola sp.]
MRETTKRKIAGLICFALAFLMTAGAEAEEELSGLYARGAVLMDGDSGRILYGKNENEQLPMASTTKIMTCILALEECGPDTICTVTENAALQPPVKLGMKTGDTFYLEDLLYSLMLESHNDTAVCIAETVGGSVESFADKMNEKSREIGCTNTYYITPNGLDAEDENGAHHTTAAELAAVMRYCLNGSPKSEEFLKITGTDSHTFSDTEGVRTYSCSNHNTFLTMMEGAVSGKTGFTGKAGYCYVGALKRDDRFLIVALLACGWPSHKGYKWSDTKKLMRYGLENFEKRVVTDQNLKTESVSVTGGWKEYAATQAQQEEEICILMRPLEHVQIQTEMTEVLKAPVLKGQQVGTVRYLVEGVTYAEYPVIIAETVNKRDFRSCFLKLAEQLLL